MNLNESKALVREAQAKASALLFARLLGVRISQAGMASMDARRAMLARVKAEIDRQRTRAAGGI
ncbi:MAG: hypothetical protein JNJ71_01995 [Rubrivivax sp.]|nr:hypothetical protein [Rubrivivax sp.]